MTTEPPAGAQIQVEGLRNLRDLGGWETPTGTVHRGRLFRSERLDELTAASHETLDQLGIRTVIDFRYQSEVEENPSKLWSAVDNHVEVPMAPENVKPGSFIERILGGEFDGLSDEWVGNMYEEILERHATKYVHAVTQAVTAGPALFHCSAGKDRTGLMAMLLLSVLGVDRSDIIADFDLTNQYRTEARMAEMRSVFTERGLDVEDFRPMMSAPVPAMHQALVWLDHNHGTAEAYLLDAGIDATVITHMRTELIDSM